MREGIMGEKMSGGVGGVMESSGETDTDHML